MIKRPLKYRALIIVLMLLVGIFLVAGSVSAEGYKEKDELFPEIEGFEHPPLSNYEWDSKGWTSAWEPLFVLCKVLFLLIVFLVRFGLMILGFGMNPTFFEDFITILWDIVQKNVWGIVLYFLPIVIVIGLFFVIKDYSQGRFQGMIKRFITFMIASACLGVFLGIGVPTIIMVNDAVDELTKAVSGELASDQDNENDPAQNFYSVIWDQMIYTPFALGEVSDPDLALTAAEASKINSEISPYSVSAGDEWAAVILRFPKGSDERNEILDLFEENHKELQVVAFNAGDRFFIVLVCLLASICVVIFTLFFGVVLIILFFYFIGVLAAGMVIIPISFVPTEAPIVLKNWAKQIIAPLVSKVVVGIYVGFVFLLTGAMLKSMEGNVLSFVVSMLFMSLLLLSSIVIFFLLLTKFGYKIFAPINTAVNPMKKLMYRRMNRMMRNRRINRRIKNPKDYDADDEEYEDDGEEVEAARKSGAGKSKDRVNNSSETRKRKTSAVERIKPILAMRKTVTPGKADPLITPMDLGNGKDKKRDSGDRT
ncbi:hypothetical protein RB620_24780 [Paenibacillus sp. LHD-117]|uniref:hypothetical protein n=1 Tax=Paenibacillus sp. LHD-117 TaxID=3071412 RepID=UPI0027E16CD1|nr:hypothetical protein [Paenibacillus sp. LHD-117]MDQ6422653.1 hypothetical protein [Paenibacillus sp. LHD-117]